MSKVHLIGNKSREENVDFELSQSVEKDQICEMFTISAYLQGSSMRKFIAMGGDGAIAHALNVKVEVFQPT